jgi:hypothetical protein
MKQGKVKLGRPKKQFKEKLVITYALVKRKHHAKFQKMITELAKQYR